MKTLTKDQVKKIIQEAPSGSDQKEIVNELINRGYMLEGLNDKNIESKNPNIVSKALGGVSKILSVPSAITSDLARTSGQIIGGLSKGNFGIANQAVSDFNTNVSKIPQDIISGFKEGVTSDSQMMSPSKAAGIKGIGGFAMDVLGDPLNALLVGPASKVSKIEDFGTNISKKIEQLIANPKTKDEAKVFEKIGKTINDVIVENGETFGEKISQYKLPSGFKERISIMNKEIPIIRQEIIKRAKQVGEVINPQIIIDKLNELSSGYLRIGNQEVGEKVAKYSKSLQEAIQKGGKITGDKALELKNGYDNLRFNLGEMGGIDGKVYKIISDGLRDQINKLPNGIGDLNKKLTTYHKAIELYSEKLTEASKTFGIKIGGAFPFVYFRGFGETGAKFGQVISKEIKNASKVMGVEEKLLKTYLPSILRNFLD
jgi:hypothetical protein